MTYFEAICKFALELQNLKDIDYEWKILVQLGTFAIVGFLWLILDFSFYFFKGRSLLGIQYTSKTKYAVVFILWPLSAAIVGYFGLIMGILNPTLQTCVMVGTTWIYLAPRIANKISKPKDIQS
ncbi:hypothetical protein [Chitinophaga niabensis]|uniref:Uncharacterized protein n=1 Tax=Chitinophaga niabensis TaxID=536979 RepID=A0A1N6KB20_9BACT|nr:hypothetical protein [Chitinophaga niabensis]SIO53731.1 hypothetical protein SAMN04488055_5469 [Chitinophaga niabensis]